MYGARYIGNMAPLKSLTGDPLCVQRLKHVVNRAGVNPHLDSVTLINGDCRNNASDLHLKSRAVHKLARCHQAVKHDACLGALVNCDGVNLPFDLHQSLQF